MVIVRVLLGVIGLSVLRVLIIFLLLGVLLWLGVRILKSVVIVVVTGMNLVTEMSKDEIEEFKEFKKKEF